jgi:hypothetical protein
MSVLGLIPPKSEPTTDLPLRISCEGMLIGATPLETPSTIVFPQPWTNQAITGSK